MRVRLEPPADLEFSEATAYFGDQSSRTAEEFVSEMIAAMHLLTQFPRIGAPVFGDVRRLLLRRFPYQLVYRVMGDEVRVYAVAHLKRRPGYWRKRIP
jgi:plasmid stabilization system protein ParE